jgi:hypothetical protein
MTEKKSKRPKSTVRKGFGILNPYGDMWTTDIFDTAEAAQRHLDDFWQGFEGKQDLARYRIVKAAQRTSFVADHQ